MKKYIKYIIIIFLIIILLGLIKISLQKDYKKVESGNNKSIKEIEEYILNITSYQYNFHLHQ